VKVAIIGSGLSGLCAGALLARAGHAVTVYEQYEAMGGVTATVERDGFRWDLGQMLVPDLGEGEPGRRILEELGVSDRVQTVRSHRGNVFPDFEIFRPERFEGRHWRRERLRALFPEDARGLDAWYRLYERVLDIAALAQRAGPGPAMRRSWKMLPILRMRRWSAQRLLDHLFSNDRLQSVFAGILADYVTRPSDFPGLLLPIINAEQLYDERIPLHDGRLERRSSWSFVVNGCGELVQALAAALEKHGGRIQTGTAVERLRIEDGRVRGLALAGGGEQPVDAVVASGGARELYLDLVGREHLPEDFLRSFVDDLAVMASVFMVHLGVDYDPSVHQHGDALCYYYLTYDIAGSVERCERNVYHEGRDGFLVYVPSLHSPEMAPPGHHAVTVYTIAPNDPVQGTWAEKKEEWADGLLALAERWVPGLREHTRTRVIVSPEDFRARTHLRQHAFGGCPPRIDRSPPRHQTPIRGLWFVGAQSEAFGGVTAAMTGAQRAVRGLLRA
jgi:phytoene dehydrogenase-like protein